MIRAGLAILLVLIASLAHAQAVAPPGINLQDEGVGAGRIQTLNCVGAGVACTRSGSVGTATIAGGSGTPGGVSGNLQTNDGAGGFGAYAGTTPCSAGDFISEIDENGAATCGTPSGGGAPTDATYWVGAAHAGLSAEINLGALSTGLVLNTGGTPSQYAGTSCTNQFPRSLNNSGAATCASVATADVTDANITYAKIQNVTATDKVLGRSTAGAGDVEEIACTAAGRAILDDADASAQRTTLGLGTIATQNANNVTISGGAVTGITDLAIADGGTGQSTAVAAFDALAPTTTQGDLIYHNGTDNVRLAKGTATQVLKMNAGATAPEWGVTRFPIICHTGDAGGFDPADGATLYLGRWNIFDPSGVYGTFQVTAVHAMTITDVVITVIIAGTAGTTGQNVAFSIRKNNTTDTALFSQDFDASFAQTASAVNLALAASDTFVVKMLCPTWTTNPTLVWVSAEIWCSIP